MIDLTRIRSIKTLEEIKRDLEEFLSSPDILPVYLNELEFSEDDLVADKEQATYLLEKVNRRIVSLTRLEVKEGLQHKQTLEPKASPFQQ